MNKSLSLLLVFCLASILGCSSNAKRAPAEADQVQTDQINVCVHNLGGTGASAWNADRFCEREYKNAEAIQCVVEIVGKTHINAYNAMSFCAENNSVQAAQCVITLANHVKGSDYNALSFCSRNSTAEIVQCVIDKAKKTSQYNAMARCSSDFSQKND